MLPIYLTLANFLLCTLWGWMYFSRLRIGHHGVKCRYRLLYVGMFVSATASGFQFQLFGIFASWPDLLVSLAMTANAFASRHKWKHGAPRDVIKPLYSSLQG